MTTVLSKLDDLLSKVNKIDDISKDIAELRAEVSAVSNCLSTLEPRVASVENKVDSISHNLAIVSSTVKVEALCVEVNLTSRCKVVVCAVYIPPQAQTRLYSLFADSLVDILSVYHNFDHVLIAGDFNLPGFNWIHPDPSTASPSANVILDLASHLGDLNRTSSMPSSLKHGATEAFRSDEMCELFADYFSSAYSTVSQDELPVPNFYTPFIIYECAVTLEDVERKLVLLDSTKGSGPDGIPPAVLKFCHSEKT
ncbi:hypothetical protein J6590_079388 [Homalodisca vitripennis]|nr:hypothetical protein J6590_079388 [Homalodisca vitripennis]